MTTSEIEDEIEYWQRECERCRDRISEYEDNIHELYGQLNGSKDAG